MRRPSADAVAGNGPDGPAPTQSRQGGDGGSLRGREACVPISCGRRVAMPQTAEAIIIGAGVMGASLAFHLTRAGMHNVLVVDKKGLCGGMTAKSGALVRMHYTNEPEARMAFASL